jgi:hypothetical protein
MSVLAAALAPVHQQYLDEARQMQALWFAAHIPLVALASRSQRWCLSSCGSTCVQGIRFTARSRSAGRA